MSTIERITASLARESEYNFPLKCCNDRIARKKNQLTDSQEGGRHTQVKSP